MGGPYMIEQFGGIGRPILRQPQLKHHWEREISFFLKIIIITHRFLNSNKELYAFLMVF